MRKHPVLVIIAVLIAAGVFLVVRHRMTEPRLTFTAVVRPGLTQADCIEELQHFGYGSGFPAAELCSHSEGHPAFHALVTNDGGRTAWLSSCRLQARDLAGKPIEGAVADVPMWLTQPGVGARPALDPDQRASLDWFLPHVPSVTIGSFVGSCSFVEYRNPPI